MGAFSSGLGFLLRSVSGLLCMLRFLGRLQGLRRMTSLQMSTESSPHGLLLHLVRLFVELHELSLADNMQTLLGRVFCRSLRDGSYRPPWQPLTCGIHARGRREALRYVGFCQISPSVQQILGSMAPLPWPSVKAASPSKEKSTRPLNLGIEVQPRSSEPLVAFDQQLDRVGPREPHLARLKEQRGVPGQATLTDLTSVLARKGHRGPGPMASHRPCGSKPPPTSSNRRIREQKLKDFNGSGAHRASQIGGP